MNVTELRRALRGLPGDMEVVVEGGPDHTYRELGSAGVTKAEMLDDGWAEYDARATGPRLGVENVLVLYP